jgi:sortase A
MTNENTPRLVWVERALIGVGVWCLAWVGLGSLEAASFRRRLVETALPAASEQAPAIPSAFVGRLEIPRLSFSELVAEGDDAGVLQAAIGHLPETALPWAPGNVVLAGHRDSVFRPLRDVRVGDELQLKTPHRAYRYLVSNLWIVDPEDVWVIAPTDKRSVTLLTCYPFTYLGRAPQRFVVRASAID